MDKERDRLATRAGELLLSVAAKRPLVQYITNFVAMDIAANALLAIGASPAMVHAPEESPEFARHIDALAINIGTLTRTAAQNMEIAVEAAGKCGKPWLLDPVGAGGLAFRNETVLRLLKHEPALIRGNASEIIGIARILGLTENAAAPRGVDSTSPASEAEQCVVQLARHLGCTIAATGPIDIVSDGARIVRIANDTAMMTRVTALGCSLSGVAGALLAVSGDAFEAAAATLAIYGVAGEMAFERSEGPASFRVAFIDMLYTIRPADLDARLKAI